MALAFSEHLKAFRPKQTILEAEGEAAKSKHLQGPSSTWVDVMKQKRAIHGNIINLVLQQRSSNQVAKEAELEITRSKKNERKETCGSKRKADSFKDDKHFISPVPTNHQMEAGLSVRGNQGFGPNRLEAAVLDLVADDSGGLQKQKSVYHWDKRSKKYIKLNNSERVTSCGKEVIDHEEKTENSEGARSNTCPMHVCVLRLKILIKPEGKAKTRQAILLHEEQINEGRQEGTLSGFIGGLLNLHCMVLHKLAKNMKFCYQLGLKVYDLYIPPPPAKKF